MTKIPVGETIVHAYGFAFREFPRVLGIAWAPLAVSIAVGLMMTPGFFGNHIDPNDREAVARFSLQMVPLSLLILFPIRAMIATGLTEQALGMRAGTTFVYFSLGASIWRLIASWLLVIIAMIVLMVGLSIVLGLTLGIGGAALGSVSTNGAAVAIAVGVLVSVFVLLFYIYLAVRLTFFIAPVVVAERKIDLARVWQLSRGNFWRIFALGLAIFVPILVVGLAVAYLTYGPELFRFVDIVSEGIKSKNNVVVQEQMRAWAANIRVRQLAVWPYSSAFSLLFAAFSSGLAYSAAAFAYREVQSSSGPSVRD